MSEPTEAAWGSLYRALAAVVASADLWPEVRRVLDVHRTVIDPHRGGDLMTKRLTYTVWARSRRDAITKAVGLASASGHVVVDGSEAERFPGGASYGVNWKVTVLVAGVAG